MDAIERIISGPQTNRKKRIMNNVISYFCTFVIFPTAIDYINRGA